MALICNKSTVTRAASPSPGVQSESYPTPGTCLSFEAEPYSLAKCVWQTALTKAEQARHLHFFLYKVT